MLPMKVESRFSGQLDTSKVRSKMIYATSKDRFKRDLDLDGTQVKLRATVPSKMSLDIVKPRSGWHFVTSPF